MESIQDVLRVKSLLPSSGKTLLAYTFEDSSLIYEFQEENLHDVISRFEGFLRGCGFQFNGTLEIVEDQ